MKKAMPILAVALLGLGVCSGALAIDVGVFVWFDTAENYPAPCARVYLHNAGNDTFCLEQPSGPYMAGPGGFYEFTNLPAGNYGIMARWIGSCPDCHNPDGDDCDYAFWSECAKFTVIDEDLRVDLHLDMDCSCD